MARISFSRKNLIRYFIFLIVIAIIFYAIPKGGKFQYEYKEKGLWQHEDLISPIQFTIKKTKSEIENEKVELKRDFKRLFIKDLEVVQKAKLEFVHSINDLVQENFDEYNFFRKNYILKKVDEFLGFIYDKGIFEIENNYEIDNNDLITIVSNNLAEDRQFNSVFTLIEARNYLIENIENDSILDKALLQERFASLLHPNVFYNRELSEKKLNSELEEISLTKGLVEEGEKIIAYRNIITHQKYQMLESLRAEYELQLNKGNTNYFIYIGYLLLIALVITGFAVYLSKFHKKIFVSNKNLILILFNILAFILISIYIVSRTTFNIYVIPYCIVPIIILTFYGIRVAFIGHLIVIIIVSIFAPNGFEFLFIQTLAGFAVILGISRIRYLSQFFITAIFILFIYYVTYFGIKLIQITSLNEIDFSIFLWFTGSFVLTLLAYPLIYAFEKLFGFVSDITLIELSDINKNLLRELSIKAPGTFQHSLQVANLSEAVTNEIGGNALLVRVGALYHDIGKILTPEYFTENQKDNENPHDKIEDKESIEILVNHVVKGAELAKKSKLPKEITNFILTHHGTTRAEFFYQKHIKDHPNEKVSEMDFRYPGPKPMSKEMAVLMMVDSIEAASRSMKEHSEEDLNNMVDKMVENKLMDKQFENANITLREINITKSFLKRYLKSIFHSRIEYPSDIK